MLRQIAYLFLAASPTSDARHVGFPNVSFPGPSQSAAGYGYPPASLAAPLGSQHLAQTPQPIQQHPFVGQNPGGLSLDPPGTSWSQQPFSGQANAAVHRPSLLLPTTPDSVWSAWRFNISSAKE